MSPRSSDVTDAEFAVLEALWSAGPQTIREVTAQLYPGLSVSDYATVQKLLTRLETKGCVRRDRSGHRHVFAATRERASLVGEQLRKTAEKLCAGSLAPLLLELVGKARLSTAERAELRKLLERVRASAPFASQEETMIRFIEHLAAGALSNALLATLAALLVWLASRFVRRPALTHALWLLVLVKLVAPVAITLPVSLNLDTSAPVLDRSLNDNAELLAENSQQFEPAPLVFSPNVNPTADNAGHAFPAPSKQQTSPSLFARLTACCEPLIQFGYRLRNPLLLLWVGGTVLFLGLVIQRVRNFGRVVGRAEAASSTVSAEVAELCRASGLRRVPRVLMLDAECSPLVWRGWRESIVLLPSALLNRFSPLERRMLLAHEIAHLERRDYLVRWLETIILSVYWWLPIAWLARRQLHAAAEECCDALVVSRFGHGRNAYAEALLKTLEFLSAAQPALPAGGSAFAQFHQLKRRFAMILHGNDCNRVGRWGALSVVLCAALLLPISLPLAHAEDKTEELSTSPIETTSESPDPSPQKVSDVAASDDDVNRRLERLERMLESLSREKLVAAPLPTPLKTNQEKAAPATIPAMASPIPLDFGFNRLEDVMESITRQVQLTETNKSRVQAASINLDAVENAFREGTVTIDLLLDAQRRAATSEIDYVDASLRLAGFMPQKERDRLQASATLDLLKRVRDKSLTVWRDVKRRYDAGTVGADQEAQTREQYFLYRDQVERANERLAEVNP